MQVYSGWPQLLSTRSSTSWKMPTASPLGTGEMGHSGAVAEVGDTEATQGDFGGSPKQGEAPASP